MSTQLPQHETHHVPVGQLVEQNFARWLDASRQAADHLGYVWPVTTPEAVEMGRLLEYDISPELLSLLHRRGICGPSPFDQATMTRILILSETRSLWLPEKPGKKPTQHARKKSHPRIKAELQREPYASEVRHEMKAFDTMLLLGMLAETNPTSQQLAIIELLRQRIDPTTLEFVELNRRLEQEDQNG